MADKTPLRLVLDGNNNPTGLAEFQSGETIGNSFLTNSSFTIVDDSSTTSTISLGESLLLAGGTGITSVVSGDSLTFSLDNTAVTPATYGSSTAIPVLIIDQQGRITGASTQNISTTLTISDDTSTLTNIDLGSDTLKIAGDSGITTSVSGDTINIDLDDTAVTPNTYGSSTAIPVITIDQQGRITGASTQNISTTLTIADDSSTTVDINLGSDTLKLSGDTGITTTISGDIVNIDLDNTAVTPATYGSSTAIPVITIDQQGRITSASTQNISTTLTISDDTSSTVDITLGSDTLKVSGTSNEIETSISGDTLTIGLPSNVTLTGDLAINGGDITTTATTFNLLNTTATTLNIGGAATTIGIGASDAVTTVNGKLVVNGAYHDTHLTTYGSLFIDGTSTNNIVQASSNTRSQGIGLWSTGGTGRVYNSGGDFEILVGTTLRDQDTPTGGTVAVTINGTTGAVQLASDLAVNGGDLTTTATTFNLLNATATTLNIGGAATTVSVGANTGTTTVNNNLTITGNLTVSGTTTTVNTTNTTVTDKLLELATGTTGSPTGDAGIIIERGDQNNIFIGYDESADVVTFASGTFTGASTGDLTLTESNIKAADITSTGNLDISGTSTLRGSITLGVNSGDSTEDSITVNARFVSNLEPLTTLVYDLGSPNRRWRDIYLSGNTIDLNGATISGDGSGAITISATGAVLPTGSQVGSQSIATADPDTGISTRFVPLYTQTSGLSTAATNLIFKSGNETGQLVFTDFTVSNGQNIVNYNAGGTLFAF
jgi:hypothetical protein